MSELASLWAKVFAAMLRAAFEMQYSGRFKEETSAEIDVIKIILGQLSGTLPAWLSIQLATA